MLTDIQMPGMDGFELARNIKIVESVWKVKNCPIIAVTACRSDDVREKAE